MTLIKFIENIFRHLFPSPFTIAIILTLLTVFLALFLSSESINNIIISWETGLWNTGLLAFTTQMMLMLVLGHSVALTRLATKSISFITKFCKNTSNSAAIVSFFSIIVSFFNWGLGLIFGAILARKVGEKFSKENKKINYPLIGAAGYCGLMVWHGGLSGSAPLKIAEKNHFNEIISNENLISVLPENINFSQTVFSSMNFFVSICLLILVPFIFFILGEKIKKDKILQLEISSVGQTSSKKPSKTFAEKIDTSNFFGMTIGGVLILLSISKIISSSSFDFINPNFINLFLLGIAIFFHSSIKNFLSSINIAIKGVGGILIQFPLYFGIMGIITSSGLVNIFSDFFISISTEFTYPIYTMISAGIVNVFVPSGGGQWAVQAPIILQTAYEIGVSFEKTIMAFVYGDQLTNMLQPFWALPLLGITGLKAKQILPYSVLIMTGGFLIFLTGVILF